MIKKEHCCVDCGSYNFTIVVEDLGKCLDCGSYFDAQEIRDRMEKFHRNSKKKDEDDVDG